MDLVAGQPVRCVEIDNALTKRSLLALQPLGGNHASPLVYFIVE
jgi:hypothetical protein